MKTKLFYFSGTGNSLKIARDLAEALGEAEIIPLSKAMVNDEVIIDSECMGIIFPVYMFGTPLIVNEFIKKLRCAKEQYIFAVATYGGRAGSALLQVKDRLSKRGLKLSAGFAVLMPGNYTPLYGAITPEKQQKIFDREKIRITEIAQIVKERRPFRIERSSVVFNFLSNFIYKLCAPHVYKMDKGFWVDAKCNSCGICQKVCPVSNIRMKDGHPAWLGRCEQCLACLQWCPQEAIQYGKSTSGRKRYHHPDVNIQDVILGEEK
ncbi:MAG: 4Fe-4S binding protein [Candidatus Omnitrophica bacterium]|nr:4Fe-4S binding protein [Candidatus Omnitrophota bacterium]